MAYCLQIKDFNQSIKINQLLQLSVAAVMLKTSSIILFMESQTYKHIGFQMSRFSLLS